MKTIRLPSNGWKNLKFWDYWNNEMGETIEAHYRNGECFPPQELIFRAFDSTPPEQVECVILGQDPYHTKGRAHGLSFSVPASCKSIPPSLKRIFDEYESDLNLPRPRSGDLSSWSKSGKLLLNTSLSVREGRPNSHRKLGWERLAYEVMSTLSSRGNRIVFMLWGKEAQLYRGCIDESNHKVIASDHPSPLAAGGKHPFRGSRPFSVACDYLGKSRDWWRLE